MKNRTFTWITDTENAWLSVPLTAIQELGLTNKVSPASSMTMTDAYLVEADAVLFQEAARRAGWPLDFGVPEFAERSRVRGYGPYNPAFVALKEISTGQTFGLHDGRDATVKEVFRTRTGTVCLLEAKRPDGTPEEMACPLEMAPKFLVPRSPDMAPAVHLGPGR